MKNKNSVKNLVLFSGLTVAAMAGVNQYIFASAVSKNALSTDHDFYYDWKLGKIYYTKEGTGSPLIPLTYWAAAVQKNRILPTPIFYMYS